MGGRGGWGLLGELLTYIYMLCTVNGILDHVSPNGRGVCFLLAAGARPKGSYKIKGDKQTAGWVGQIARSSCKPPTAQWSRETNKCGGGEGSAPPVASFLGFGQNG